MTRNQLQMQTCHYSKWSPTTQQFTVYRMKTRLHSSNESPPLPSWWLEPWLPRDSQSCSWEHRSWEMESPTVWPCVRLLLFSHSLGHLQIDITIVLSVSGKLSIFSPYKHNSWMSGCIASTPNRKCMAVAKMQAQKRFSTEETSGLTSVKHSITVALLVGVLRYQITLLSFVPMIQSSIATAVNTKLDIFSTVLSFYM